MLRKNEAESTNEQAERKDNMDFEEDEVEVQKAITTLRSLVSEEKDLQVRMDDSFMLRYLRATEFKPQEAFERMVKFYKLKLKYEDYFCSTSPSEYKHLFEQNFLNILEDRDQKGRRILLYRLKNVDTNSVYFSDCSKLFDVWAELILEEEETQKNGFVAIMDLEGLPWTTFRHITPRAVYINSSKEELRPWKNREFHVVNTSPILNGLYKLVFPLLSHNFRQRIHLHERNWAELHKFIDPNVLPEEYGGNKSVNFATMQEYVLQNEKKLSELLSLGYKTKLH